MATQGTVIAQGSYILRLGPMAQSIMFPSSAKLVSGEPTRVILRVEGTIRLECEFLRMDDGKEPPARTHIDFVREVLDGKGNVLWRHPALDLSDNASGDSHA